MDSDVAVGFSVNGELKDVQYNQIRSRLIQSAKAIGAIDNDFDPDNGRQCVTTWSSEESPNPTTPSPTPSSNEPYPTPSPTLSPTPSSSDVDDDDDGCEDSTANFLMNYNKNTDTIVLKDCSFLATKSQSFIEKKCKYKVNYLEDPNNDDIVYRPPQIMCAFTCGACGKCFQNMKTKFLHYKRGNGKEITKRCGWLKNQSTEKKNKLCDKDLNGLYPSALEACPIICGKVGCERI